MKQHVREGLIKQYMQLFNNKSLYIESCFNNKAIQLERKLQKRTNYFGNHINEKKNAYKIIQTENFCTIL